MRHHRSTRAAAVGLVLAAFAAPTAVAQTRQDLRSPDTRDAARNAQSRQDLRSPDARDAATGRGTFNAPEVTVIRVPEPAPAPDGGIDWGDAGIGAGGLLTVILLATGGTFAITRHRRGARAPMASTV